MRVPSVEMKTGNVDGSRMAVCDGIGSLLIDQPVLAPPFFPGPRAPTKTKESDKNNKQNVS